MLLYVLPASSVFPVNFKEGSGCMQHQDSKNWHYSIYLLGVRLGVAIMGICFLPSGSVEDLRVPFKALSNHNNTYNDRRSGHHITRCSYQDYNDITYDKNQDINNNSNV